MNSKPIIKTDDTPLVSCITPTYNRSALLKEAIESNLAQTFQNWEMLIVDDQSTDDTWEMIESYAKRDSRIRCFQNPVKGANNARNLGIRKARGKYIAFLDDDDVNLPGRYESQIRAVMKSGSRFILSWFEVRDRKNRFYKKINRTILKGKEANFPSRWMIEKSLLDEVNGFNPKMAAMQDSELSYRIAEKYTFDHHDDVVSIVYNCPESTSKGVNAIKGKIQLLEEVGHIVPQEEQAAWLFSISCNYLRMNDTAQARDYLKKGAEKMEHLKRFFPLYNMVLTLSGKLNLGLWGGRILSRMFCRNTPLIVKHRVIDSH